MPFISKVIYSRRLSLVAFWTVAFVEVHLFAVQDEESSLLNAVSQAYSANYSAHDQFCCSVKITIVDLRPSARTENTLVTDTVTIVRRPVSIFNGALSVDGNRIHWVQRDEQNKLIEKLSFDGQVWRRFDAITNKLATTHLDGLGGKIPIDIRNTCCDTIQQTVPTLLASLNLRPVSSDGDIRLAGKSVHGETCEILFRQANGFLPSEVSYSKDSRKSREIQIMYERLDGIHFPMKSEVSYFDDSGQRSQRLVYEVADVELGCPLVDYSLADVTNDSVSDAMDIDNPMSRTAFTRSTSNATNQNNTSRLMNPAIKAVCIAVILISLSATYWHLSRKN